MERSSDASIAIIVIISCGSGPRGVKPNLYILDSKKQ